MRATFTSIFALLCALPSVASNWVRPEDEESLIAHVKSFPQAREFVAAYPRAKLGRVSHPHDVVYTPETEQEVEETLYARYTVGLYGRYVLTMAVPLKLAEDRVHLAFVGQPTFGIQEVENVAIEYVDNLPRGSAHIRYTTFSTTFGYDQFKEVQEHQGDFGTIGIKLDKHAPIEDFDRAWKPDE